MMSIVGLRASNPDVRRGILCTRLFWQLTRQSLPMRPTPWATSLYRVPEDSVCYTTTERLSWSKVGFIHHCPTC
jgi:hypothetical protein